MPLPDCTILFSQHALERLAERSLSPQRLLKLLRKTPIHQWKSHGVVARYDSDSKRVTVVTCWPERTAYKVRLRDTEFRLKRQRRR